MQSEGSIQGSCLLDRICGIICKCFFSVLAFGPIPAHIAFIMDGNRRYANNTKNTETGHGHRLGFAALVSVLSHCYELDVKYVTIYAFSIDNFKRKPEEVQLLMDLMKEKIEELLQKGSIVAKYGVKINFWGDLSLLTEPVRTSAEKAMALTSGNSGPVLSVCVAYTSTSEILRAVHGSCKEKMLRRAEELISVDDLERHLFTTGCPDPEIVIRTSGETRLSNFLLWQTQFSHLQSPAVLWPEFSVKNLVWAILEYQRQQPYLEARRKEDKKKL